MLDHELELRFCKARRAAIAHDFYKMNEQQKQAVLATEGPLLLLAGAGSGKTTVLINRIANLMKYGRGSDSVEVPEWVTAEDVVFLEGYAAAPDARGQERAQRLCQLEPALPWSILAITFTNKAAGELKERLERMLGPAANEIWASTFHSACVRILRRDIEKLGFSSSFTIYDTDDSLRVIKDILKENNIDDKQFPPRTVLGYISRAKDEMKLGAEYLAQCRRSGDFRKEKIAQIYAEYERRLWEASALDFDDIILHTVRLLQQDEQVRTYYQRKFRYVLIDEYQDTNNLQYLLASTLAGGYENFCVVGDDDQSIYRFRGATIKNILDFEEQYKGARVIRLEQNYRSTGNILNAANAVIKNNPKRKEKHLWTCGDDGEKIQVYSAMNEHDEAQYIVTQILSRVGKKDGDPNKLKEKDFAILYRSNSVSNIVYQALLRNGIEVYMRHPMTAAAEIRDVMAYMYLVQNHDDNLRLKRIVNVPPRGIGEKTVESMEILAKEKGISIFSLMSSEVIKEGLGRTAGKVEEFRDLILDLSEKAKTAELSDFYIYLLERSGYIRALREKETPENNRRIEHLMEFKSVIQDYIERYLEKGVEPSLSGFLEEMALDEELGNQSEEDDEKPHKPKEERVQMMTMHSAKGLEFPVVFIIAAEDGVFPSRQSIDQVFVKETERGEIKREREGLEEERRLCYVAITRAKQELYITFANQRMLYGKTEPHRISRFLEEIPGEYLERSGRSFLSRDENAWEGGIPSRTSGYEGYSNPYRTAGRAPSGVTSYRAPTSGASKYPLPGKKPVTSSGTASSAAPMPEYRKGDMVQHKAFGKGMVTSTQKVGGDTLIEIAFDNVGTKRLMLKFAAPQLTKL